MVGMKNKDKLRVLVFYSASADWWKKIDKNGRVNNLGALGSLFSLGIDLAGLHTHSPLWEEVEADLHISLS